MPEDLTYRRPCFYCGEHVDPLAQTTFRRVSGWERKAVSQSRRGGSDIMLREPMEDFACFGCIERRRSGLDVSQGSLL